LLVTSLHEVVRDFPETLAVLRVGGGDPRVHGGGLLSRVDGWEALLSLLVDATRWRPTG